MKRGANIVQLLDAVKREVHGLVEAGAFDVVGEQQRIENCIGWKLVFDWKADAFDFETKAKARLVARGDMEREFCGFFRFVCAYCCNVEYSFTGCFCE